MPEPQFAPTDERAELDRLRKVKRLRELEAKAAGGGSPSRAFAPLAGVKSESGFPANPMMASASVQRHKPQFRLPTLEEVGTDVGKGLMTAPQRVERGVVGAAEGVANLPRDTAETFAVPYSMAGNPEVSAMFSEAGMTGDPATGPERFSKIYNEGGYAEQQKRLNAAPRFDFSGAKLPIPEGQDSITGNIMEGLVQFIAARTAIGKAAPGGGLRASVAKDIAATGSGFAGNTNRVADIIDPNAIPEGPLRDYATFLKNQPGDSPLVGRFKNMLEDATLNAPVVGVMAAARGVKAANGLLSPSAQPSGPPVTAVPPTAPRAAQGGQAGAGQQAGAPPVINAVPAAPVLSKGQQRVARDTARILGRIMRSSRIKDADVMGYLSGAIQRYKAVDDRRLPFAFFLESDLPNHFPQPVADDVVTKLRTWGRERNAATGSQDTSRKTTQGTINELRGSQQDYLSDVTEKNTFKGSLIEAEDKIRAEIKKNQKIGYQGALDAARAEFSANKATPDQMDALAELGSILKQEAFQKDIPRSMRYEALNEGIDIDELIQRDPIDAAHWIQSMLGKAERKTTDAGEEALYGSMRKTLLNRIERAVPGYSGARKRHGDLFATDDAVTFGDDLSKVAKNERLTEKKARELKTMSRRQKTVAVKSIRDFIRNQFRGTPEDVSAKVTLLQQEGFLDALEKILGKRGKNIAAGIRKIRVENLRVQAIDQSSGSNTFKNMAGAEAAREMVQSPVNKAVGAFGDKTSWPMTVAGDVVLASSGLPPVLSAGKAATALVDRFGNPSAKTLSRAAEGLYSLPPAKPTNGLRVTPSPAKPPRGRKTKAQPQIPADIDGEIRSLRQQLDKIDQRANPGEGDRIIARIGELERARARPPSTPSGPVGRAKGPINQAGFGGGGSRPGFAAPAVRYRGRTYRGRTHPDAMAALEKKVGYAPEAEISEGFVTSDGRFVDRSSEDAVLEVINDPRTPPAIRQYLEGRVRRGERTVVTSEMAGFGYDDGARLPTGPSEAGFGGMSKGDIAKEVAWNVGMPAAGYAGGYSVGYDYDGDGTITDAERRQAGGMSAVGNLMIAPALRHVGGKAVNGLRPKGPPNPTAARTGPSKMGLGDTEAASDVRYFEPNATAQSLKAMREKMIADGVTPGILLFRTDSGRIIAFGGEDVGYSHDMARRLLGLGDLKLDHGVYNPKRWKTPEEMARAGPDAWYATTGKVKDSPSNEGLLVFRGSAGDEPGIIENGRLGLGKYSAEEPEIGAEWGGQTGKVDAYRIKGKLFDLDEETSRGLENYARQDNTSQAEALFARLKSEGYVGVRDPWSGHINVFDEKDMIRVREKDMELGSTWTNDKDDITQAGFGGTRSRSRKPSNPDILIHYAARDLGAQEFEAWKLARQGMSNEDIAVSMGGPDGSVTPRQVHDALNRARDKGFDVERTGTNVRSSATSQLIDMKARGESNDAIYNALYRGRDRQKAMNQIRQLTLRHAETIEAKRSRQMRERPIAQAGFGSSKSESRGGPPQKPTNGLRGPPRAQGIGMGSMGAAQPLRKIDPDAPPPTNDARAELPKPRGEVIGTKGKGGGGGFRGPPGDDWPFPMRHVLGGAAGATGGTAVGGFTGSVSDLDGDGIAGTQKDQAIGVTWGAGIGAGGGMGIAQILRMNKIAHVSKASGKRVQDLADAIVKARGYPDALHAQQAVINTLRKQNASAERLDMAERVLAALRRRRQESDDILDGRKPPPSNVAPLKSNAEQQAREELRTARLAYTTARKRHVMDLENRDKLNQPFLEAEHAAAERLRRVLENEGRMRTAKARVKDVGSVMKRELEKEDFPGSGSVKGLLIAGGTIGLAGAGAVAALNGLRGPPAKPGEKPINPSSPEYYWSTIVKDKAKVTAIQEALAEQGFWDMSVKRNGSYGPVTRDAIRSWRYENGLDPDKPMTKRDVQKLLAPKGYEDPKDKSWRYGDGAAVPAL